MQELSQKDRKMKERRSVVNIRIAVAILLCAAAILLLTMVFSRLMDRRDPSGTVLGYTVKSGETLTRMRIHLLKAVELEKSAFMATTDEESRDFADCSLRTADAVERDRRELKGLIDDKGTGEEKGLLTEFGACWEKFREIDRELLPLSTENTNIKAARLSHTKGAEAIGRFERAMAQLVEGGSSAEASLRILRLAYQAVTAALTVYNLQAPHIDEAQDAKMDEIESIMKSNEKRARAALKDLARIVDPRGRTFLDAASLSFEDFMKVNAAVIRLSRINSNVKSLQISLGRKRKVAAQCEEILNSLQEAIRAKSFKATK